MGQRPRHRPKQLAAKLLAISKQRRLSQSELASALEFNQAAARISEYESGVREPQLFLLLRYARLAGVCTCVLIDDDVELTSKSHKHSRK